MVRAVRRVSSADLSYSVVDTNQTTRFDDKDSISDQAVFVGQDADYANLAPSYRDNGDGTVSDLNTGLMWQQSPGEKMSWDEAYAALKECDTGGYLDWRMPTIKELYSLIQFSGRDVDPMADGAETPFIDTDYFDFEYGDTDSGERIIDSQYMSSTRYVSTTMNGDDTVFGVNFADGRIKGYGMELHGEDKTFFVLYVRGNEEYGKNNFVDNGDGTVSDLATGLMWMRHDAGPMNWEEALEYCEDLDSAGYDDWRLPDAKELQSLVDYSRSPGTSDSPAIDPVFSCRPILNEKGEKDWAFYWSSTTHASQNSGSAGAYVCFGRAMGNMASPEGMMPGADMMQRPPTQGGRPGPRPSR
jgi:hypothetical protein